MATKAQARRTLWLLRHAKAVTDPPPGGSDWDRVLAPRGRRDAAALGRLFAGNGEGLGGALKRVPRPAVALVSPAARTAPTAELALARQAEPPELRFEEELYGADPDEVIALLRTLPDDAEAAMVVGHNPTMQASRRGCSRPATKRGSRWRCGPASPPAHWASTASTSRAGPTWRPARPSWLTPY